MLNCGYNLNESYEKSVEIFHLIDKELLENVVKPYLASFLRPETPMVASVGVAEDYRARESGFLGGAGSGAGAGSSSFPDRY